MSLQVLAADDNEFSGIQYQKAFEKHGHSIVIAKDGEDCISKYMKALTQCAPGNNPFNVVLLDFVMPKKNGVLAAKEILEANPHQKIIFVSAFGNGVLDDATIFLKDSAVEIIQKPFSLEFLVNKIEKGYAVINIH